MPGRVRGSTPQPPSTIRPMIVIRSSDGVAADADQGVGDVAEIVARAGGLRAVERVAVPRVRAHLERVGQDDLSRRRIEASAKLRVRSPLEADPAP